MGFNSGFKGLNSNLQYLHSTALSRFRFQCRFSCYSISSLLDVIVSPQQPG